MEGKKTQIIMIEMQEERKKNAEISDRKFASNQINMTFWFLTATASLNLKIGQNI